jgi:hypothetical protein
MKKNEPRLYEKVEEIFFFELIFLFVFVLRILSTSQIALSTVPCTLLLFVSFDFLSSLFRSLFPLRLSKNIIPYFKKITL